MKWLKSSDLSIKSTTGNFFIAKSGIEVPMFCLWQGNELVKCFTSAEEAKQCAESMAGGDK